MNSALHAQLRRSATPERPAKVINIASIDGISVKVQQVIQVRG